MPSTQKSLTGEGSEKWTNELLEESLGLVDFCEFARDVLSLTKGSFQELQSSIRRNRGEVATADDINACVASRKMINRMVNKCIENFKSISKNSTRFLNEDSDLEVVAEMLKDTEAFDFSDLKPVLMLLSGEKGRSKKRRWSLISRFTQTSQVSHGRDHECGAQDLISLNLHMSGKSTDTADAQNVLKQLKKSEVAILELEEALEAFYTALVKTRVSLLNVLDH